MADILDGPSQHSTGGFQGAPVSKFFTGASIVGHVALHVPLFASFRNFLHCNLSRVLENGQWWRLVASKLIFIDTKDAIFCLILLYQFRIFERRYGSRNFSSQLLATSFFTTFIELLIALGLSSISEKPYPLGSLALGPFCLVLPLFINYFNEIPVLRSSGAGSLTSSISSKSMFYIIGAQVAFSSTENASVFVASIIAGFLVRKNFLWAKQWIRVPKIVASVTDKLFGWLVNTEAPSTSELLGATLEIQRTQTAELMEQRMIRQQQNMFEERNRRVNRVGQGFQEQLVNNHQFFQRQMPNIGAGGEAIGGNAPAEPLEQNVQTLVDMGFPRERVVAALRQCGNDIQSATLVLLRGDRGI